MTDNWHLFGQEFTSRLLLGTALYPSPQVMQQAITASGAEIITVSLRRQALGTEQNTFWNMIKELGLQLLPNTAGCHSTQEAVTLAKMAREVFETNWIKLEVIGDDYNLQPDPFLLVEAADLLVKDGFHVLPYCTDDLILCQRLLDIGCEVLMPWGAPIGTGKGLLNPYALEVLRNRFPEIPMIIDAGLGRPSHACLAMEMGMDGVLLNTAVAKAHLPVMMARGFQDAVKAGRQGFLSGIMPERALAKPSTPTIGQPFWKQENY